MKKSVAEKVTALPTEAGVTRTQEAITPEKAEEYLSKNFHRNRGLLLYVAAKYARDMAGLRWRDIGDPIRFDKDGNLIDGQHRLHAIVLSGATVTMTVIRGLDTHDIHLIDTGKARTPGDMLRMAGYSSSHLRAATLRMMLHVKEGPVTDRTIRAYSFDEILLAAEKHPALGESCVALRKTTGINPSLTVALHYIGGHILGRKETADAFISVLNTGLPTYEDDAAHKFRERAIQNVVRGAERWGQAFSLRAGIHVWNLFANKEPMRAFRIPETVAIDGLDTELL